MSNVQHPRSIWILVMFSQHAPSFSWPSQLSPLRWIIQCVSSVKSSPNTIKGRIFFPPPTPIIHEKFWGSKNSTLTRTFSQKSVVSHNNIMFRFHKLCRQLEGGFWGWMSNRDRSIQYEVFRWLKSHNRPMLQRKHLNGDGIWRWRHRKISLSFRKFGKIIRHFSFLKIITRVWGGRSCAHVRMTLSSTLATCTGFLTKREIWLKMRIFFGRMRV